jgi:hypothetical protein
MSIPQTLSLALNEVLGNNLTDSADFHKSRRKDGSVVYGITGTQGLFRKPDGSVHVNGKTAQAEITADNIEALRSQYPYFSVWEWHLLRQGVDNVRDELTLRLRERGIDAEIRIGEGAAYPASVAIRLLSVAKDPSEGRPRVDRRRPMIEQLLGLLPAPGSVWPESERTRFLAALTAMIDLLYPPAD